MQIAHESSSHFASTVATEIWSPRPSVDGVTPTQEGPTSEDTGRQPVVVVANQNRIGRFVLLRQIGEGGMGSVFAAYDEDLDRKVAIKILRKPEATIQLQRTLHEAKALARVSHPNVVSIYEVGQTKDSVYIAMEYVEGGTLLGWQVKQPRSWQEVLSMYLQAGEGLAAAHQAGIVHRDFKPENVLVGQDGRPRVADFGIARMCKLEECAEFVSHPAADAVPKMPSEGRPGEASPVQVSLADAAKVAGQPVRLTMPGVISGTPGYMSPEQYRGGDVDARSDQFSFCAALFEALYGHLPFSGKSLAEMSDSLHGPIHKPPPSCKVPPELYQTLCTGLHLSPIRRFATMDGLLSSLALEDSHHAGAGGVSLRQFAQVAMGVMMLLVLFAQYRTAQRALNYKQMLTMSAVSLAVTLIGGFVKRKTLLMNRFHRRLWILISTFIVLNFGQRLLGMVFQTPLIQLIPFELLALAAIITVAASIALPALWWVPILLVGATIATVAAPETMRPVITIPYTVGFFSTLLGWMHYSKAAKLDVASMPRRLVTLTPVPTLRSEDYRAALSRTSD